MCDGYGYFRSDFLERDQHFLTKPVQTSLVVLVVQWLGVRLVIERSLVRLPAGALSSQLGQLSFASLRDR